MSKEMPLLKLKNVSKFYYNKGLVSSGFSKVNLEFNLGEFVAITGESGSGKSTLLNVLSGLDTYEEGEMYINGSETSHYNESDFEKYRKTYIGNIFQTFNLVGSYTVYQNIELVLLLNGYKKKDIHQKIINIIKQVDLMKFKNTRVSRLSGGQKQRVAIARALAKETPIIIADEPTGNLDSKNAKSVLKLLADIAQEKLVIVVTHNYEQIEEYATRKIEMHDGKVREDIDIKPYKKCDTKLTEYKDITFFNQIRLSFRNTFNILHKFILMFIVFLFLITAFLGEYAAFKNQEYQLNKEGYNSYFRTTDDTRIVINKKDKTAITNEDIKKLKILSGVSSIVEDDILLDTHYDLNDNNNYFLYGSLETANNLKKVDVGRMPEKANEIVIKGYNTKFYYEQSSEKFFNADMRLYNNYGLPVSDEPLKVVGAIFTETYTNDIYYVSEELLDNIRLTTNEMYAKETVTINEKDYFPDEFGGYLKVMPSQKVEVGKAIVSYDINYLCKYSWCKNKTIKIKAKNMYFETEIDVVVKSLYTKKSFENLTGYKNYELNGGSIFISNDDYNKLYNSDKYQVSVFANDVRQVNELSKNLKKLGYNPLNLKDSIVNYNEEILTIINVFKIIVTTVLFIVLFFIAYFVIRLIQKSKNVYYATVRILGGSKKTIDKLIKYELCNIFNITYMSFIIFIYLISADIIKVRFISNLVKFLSFKDYVIIYLIMFIMSYLIAKRYSRKLFKSSAMKTYNEEV